MYYLVDWVKRVDFDAIREYRNVRMIDSLKKHNLRGAIIFKVDSIKYATGMHPSWMPSVPIRNAAVVSADPGTTPISFVASGNWRHRVETTEGLPKDSIHPFPYIENPVASLKVMPLITDALEKLNLTSGRVGIDLAPLYFLEPLKKAMPNVEWVDVNGCIEQAKAIKHPDEVKLVETAARCADLGVQAALDAVGPGVREWSVFGIGWEKLYSLGMGMPQGMPVVASGENVAPFTRYATDRVISYGDTVCVSLGGNFNGVWAELTRTTVCHEPNKDQVLAYRTAYNGLHDVLESLRPGVKGTTIMDQLNASVEKQSSGARIVEDVVRGIGVSGTEPPYVGPHRANDEAELKEGMTVSVRVSVSLPGNDKYGFASLSQMVYISSNGADVLSTTPFDDRLL